jgi:hypothetical protein
MTEISIYHNDFGLHYFHSINNDELYFVPNGAYAGKQNHRHPIVDKILRYYENG